MENDTITKLERFNKLVDTYAIALHITYKIMDSGLLEQKIKLGNDTQKITSFIDQFLPIIANEFRYADRVKGSIKSTKSSARYHEGALDIANAYFQELNTKGNEWEYADLEELFITYKEEAENQIEESKEKGY